MKKLLRAFKYITLAGNALKPWVAIAVMVLNSHTANPSPQQQPTACQQNEMLIALQSQNQVKKPTVEVGLFK